MKTTIIHHSMMNRALIIEVERSWGHNDGSLGEVRTKLESLFR